jgi:hypothetical protein
MLAAVRFLQHAGMLGEIDPSVRISASVRSQQRSLGAV